MITGLIDWTDGVRERKAPEPIAMVVFPGRQFDGIGWAPCMRWGFMELGRVGSGPDQFSHPGMTVFVEGEQMVARGVASRGKPMRRA